MTLADRPGWLGPLLVLTDRAQSEAAGRPLVDTIEVAATAGAAVVLFREKDLPSPDRRRLAEQVADALAGTDTALVVASDVALAEQVGAAGVHLAATDPPLPGDADRCPSGRSCHSAADVDAARAEGAAWVTLSPIFASVSKPGYGPPLGVDALDGHALPVFALGGITPENAAACRAAGAHGVAVLGAVMSAADPAAVVATLRSAVA